MINFFEYEFILKAVMAASAIALTAPLIGMFLVAKRYSLISDTLSHTALLGAVIGVFVGAPIITTMLATIASAIGIERVRMTKKFSGEAVLALFLFGSLAIASILISRMRNAGNVLSGLLFGSIATIGRNELLVILAAAIGVIALIIILYKKLFAVCFDEEAAQASGVDAKRLNIVFILAAAIIIALSVRIVGALLIGALMTIPVLAAFLFKQGFFKTMLIALAISFVSALSGIAFSYTLNLPSGGSIIGISLFIFAGAWMFNKKGSA